MFNKNIQSAEIADFSLMKSEHLVGRVLLSESRGGIRLLLQTESCADRILAISGWWRQRRPLTLRAAISSSLPIWETTDQRSRLPASEYPVKGTC